LHSIKTGIDKLSTEREDERETSSYLLKRIEDLEIENIQMRDNLDGIKKQTMNIVDIQTN
jgi:hypothetical protein